MAKTSRRGRIMVFISQLLDADELKTKTVDELNTLLNKKLSFNDYYWQEKHMIDFKGRKLAEGLEKILYKCPCCGEEFQIKTFKNTVECKQCGFKLLLNKKGFFENNKHFKTPHQWFEYQKQQIQAEISSSSFKMCAKTKIKSIRNGKLVLVGEGIVILNSEQIVFEGIIDGDEQTILIKTKDLVSLPYRAGENFELSYNNNVFQFHLERGLEVVKWSISVEEIYKKKHDGN